MYFRASQLPQLSSLSYLERAQILISAARAHNRWMFFRVAVVFGLMIATTTAINFLPYSLFLPEWSTNAAIAIYGVLLYVLLLWEFNGPLGRAVAKHLSTGKSDAPTV